MGGLPEDVDTNILGTPEIILSNMEKCNTPLSYVEVRLILESIESLYRFDKIKSIDTAKEKLTDRLPLFERLLALNVSNPLSHVETRHHKGKALKILGHTEEASKQFEQVMAGPIPLNATRLQLIRIYAGKNDRALDLADDILTAAKTPLKVVSSVVLGVLENLSWAKGDNLHLLFDKHAELIEREIVSAAEAGLEQAYSALASVGRYWAWHEPARLTKIFDLIPVPAVGTADTRTAAALGEILIKLAKFINPPNRELQKQAERYYRTIPKPDNFQLQKYGEILIDLGEFSEAETRLRSISDLDSNAFAAYRLSQAKFGQGNIDEALSFIDMAIKNLDESKQKFAASFWVHRFKIRQANEDQDAVNDLDKAIADCTDKKYLSHIEKLRRDAA